MLISAKFHDDKKLGNDLFGKIGGISNQEINLLELNFLERIGFNLLVEGKVFNGYLMQILGTKIEE